MGIGDERIAVDGSVGLLGALGFGVGADGFQFFPAGEEGVEFLFVGGKFCGQVGHLLAVLAIEIGIGEESFDA